MSINLWRPWLDPSRCGAGAQPERYALRMLTRNLYFGIAASSESERIQYVPDPQAAWVFHTHQRAVAAAREIAAVYGEAVEVVKLL
jgi:hypothetical protein